METQNIREIRNEVARRESFIRDALIGQSPEDLKNHYGLIGKQDAFREMLRIIDEGRSIKQFKKLITDGQRSAFYNEKFYQLPEDAVYRYKASGRNEAFKGIIQFCKENKSLRLHPTDYKRLSSLLVDSVIENGAVDEIRYNGFVFVFTCRPEHRSETRTTGVEFLGEKETYLHDNVTLRDFALQGVYDAEGDKVDSDLNVRRLNINYKDDDITVSAVPKPSE